MSDMPAPGTYNPSDLDSTREYILSTNKNGGTKKFMLPTTPKGNLEISQISARRETPGPGSYQIASTFGELFARY